MTDRSGKQEKSTHRLSMLGQRRRRWPNMERRWVDLHKQAPDSTELWVIAGESSPAASARLHGHLGVLIFPDAGHLSNLEIFQGCERFARGGASSPHWSTGTRAPTRIRPDSLGKDPGGLPRQLIGLWFPTKLNEGICGWHLTAGRNTRAKWHPARHGHVVINLLMTRVRITNSIKLR